MDTLNAIISAVLKTKKISPENLSGIKAVDLLQGFVNLLSMKDIALAIMLDDESALEEMLQGRKYFQKNNLDIDLMKKALPLIERFAKNGVSEEWDTEEYTKCLLHQPTIEIYSVLDKILYETGLPLRTFAIGKTLDDILSLRKKLVEGEQKTPKQSPKKKSNDAKAEKQEVGETQINEDTQSVPKPAYGQDAFLALSKQYSELRQNLLARVKGQEDAVNEFVKGLFQCDVLQEEDKLHPKGVFLFVGPPGVGKTFLARTAFEELKRPYKVFNMSEYSTDESHEDLIGISNFYKNAREGTLVKFVRENPKAILVFDEIEKAHRNVIQLFLQILDLAALDNIFLEETTDFSNTTIVFTSNACASLYEGEDGRGRISRIPKNVIMTALRDEKNPTTGVHVFPQAICSRLAAGNVMMFNNLGADIKNQMIKERFAKIANKVKNTFGYELDITPEVSSLFMLHHGKDLDGRIIAQQSGNFIKNELFEISRQLESHPNLLKNIKKLSLKVDLDDKVLAPEIRDLFNNTEVAQFVIVCRPEDKEKFVTSKRCQMCFADSMDELKKLLQDKVTAVFVDPWIGFTEDSARGIAIDDYNTEGIHIINSLLESETLPLYLIESNKKIMNTDVYAFYTKGAKEVLSIRGKSAGSITKTLNSIADELQAAEKIQKFSRQGYVLEFNTAQVTQRLDTLEIIFHTLKKKQAIDADSSSSFIRDSERPATKFEDVIGAADAKEELKHFIDYLQNPRAYTKNGKKPPKGVLLYGPPGTGKTMLARAMAGESNMAFIQTTATEFMNQYIGQSEQNVRDLFKRARKYAPAIIFIDEIDAIGKKRTGQDTHTEKILNTLLTEMDGFKVNLENPIFVLAATNLKDNLDEALLRRFDNQIYVDLPNEEERLEYLKLATKKNGIAITKDETLRNVAKRTPGQSIALLENIIALALRIAEKMKRQPTDQDLDEAVETYNYGQKHEWDQKYYKQVAIHESGHAYIAYISGEKPSYVTIVSRGDFGGYMMHDNEEKKPNYTKQELLGKIRCSLAGRLAEEVFEEDLFAVKDAKTAKSIDSKKEHFLNTGASSDLQQATSLAAQIICEYGMMDGIQATIPFEKLINSPLAAEYISKINTLLKTETEVTRKLLQDGKDKVKELADSLLKKNHLTGEEIERILGDKE